MTTDGQAQYRRIDQPAQMQPLLDTLLQAGGARLVWADQPGEAVPVLVQAVSAEEGVLLDLSAVPELLAPLAGGEACMLLGQYNGGQLRTAPLSAAGPVDAGHGSLLWRGPYPQWVDWLQRRDTFRATLGLGMRVPVLARREAVRAEGWLRDLSVQGCLVEFAAGNLSILGEGTPLELTLSFPNGSRLVLDALARYQRADVSRGLVSQGFSFVACSTEQERQLWYYVREIEREAARGSGGNQTLLVASPLFRQDAPEPAAGTEVRAAARVPQYSRLARIAAYLDSQILLLREGGVIEPGPLSRQAEILLTLHDEDREALLFASHCLHREPALVRHCISVAVMLLDICLARDIPRRLCKAVAAAALVHDLGKALLPDAVREADVITPAQFSTLATHVAALDVPLAGCGWLTAPVIDAVVRRINERLDGSGYPAGLSGEALPALARLAAVVDVVDAMSHPRADRPARGIDTVYRHLLDAPQQFDGRCVQDYIRHFGTLPVGTLVRYAEGQLARVLRLDITGRPMAVQLTAGNEAPDAGTGEVLRGRTLARLGEPRAVPEYAMPAQDSHPGTA
ncbi:metal-dependent phosphohydrolase, HD domain-containing protein [Isoalcanivorax pacificus W11-5]|uniref:Metal-dependent phosphohydrolase, HD domain-containing protein n=1 Tax=Isoalcanivorax pacificus W11-5 TaxID=391936 RepID=A0A0B4XQ52_9GAMM|nr:HD domain-containing phosphohydrolase [Isoalcanivorax pacificus]AJD49346.1 metal-dependent phosphohydrolase, HD domain-containing protein [Isoalcanivorax pacificus W11-5]